MSLFSFDIAKVRTSLIPASKNKEKIKKTLIFLLNIKVCVPTHIKNHKLCTHTARFYVFLGQNGQCSLFDAKFSIFASVIHASKLRFKGTNVTRSYNKNRKEEK